MSKKTETIEIKNNPINAVELYLLAWQKKDEFLLYQSMQRSQRNSFPLIKKMAMFAQNSDKNKPPIFDFKVLRKIDNGNSAVQRFVYADIDFGEGMNRYRLAVVCEKIQDDGIIKPSIFGEWGVCPIGGLRKIET